MQPKYLNKHKSELFEGRTITFRGFVYWANISVKGIYRMSLDAHSFGRINGERYADITETFEIVKR